MLSAQFLQGGENFWYNRKEEEAKEKEKSFDHWCVQGKAASAALGHHESLQLRYVCSDYYPSNISREGDQNNPRGTSQ